MPSLNAIEALELRVDLGNQDGARVHREKFFDELNCVRKVVPIEIGLVVFVFKDEDRHPDDLVLMPDSAA